MHDKRRPCDYLRRSLVLHTSGECTQSVAPSLRRREVWKAASDQGGNGVNKSEDTYRTDNDNVRGREWTSVIDVAKVRKCKHFTKLYFLGESVYWNVFEQLSQQCWVHNLYVFHGKSSNSPTVSSFDSHRLDLKLGPRQITCHLLPYILIEYLNSQFPLTMNSTYFLIFV